MPRKFLVVILLVSSVAPNVFAVYSKATRKRESLKITVPAKEMPSSSDSLLTAKGMPLTPNVTPLNPQARQLLTPLISPYDSQSMWTSSVASRTSTPLAPHLTPSITSPYQKKGGISFNDSSLCERISSPGILDQGQISKISEIADQIGALPNFCKFPTLEQLKAALMDESSILKKHQFRLFFMEEDGKTLDFESDTLPLVEHMGNLFTENESDWIATLGHPTPQESLTALIEFTIQQLETLPTLLACDAKDSVRMGMQKSRKFPVGTPTEHHLTGSQSAIELPMAIEFLCYPSPHIVFHLEELHFGRAHLIKRSEPEKGQTKKFHIAMDYISLMPLANLEITLPSGNPQAAEKAIIQEISLHQKLFGTEGVGGPGIASGPNGVSKATQGRQTTISVFSPLYQGDLRSPVMTAEEKKRAVEQLLSGLTALHLAYVHHRDLKPENFLFRRTKNGIEAGITDFGTSIEVGPTSLTNNRTAGTYLYFSPQYAGQPPPSQAEPYSSNKDLKNDIWAMGLSLWEIFSGQSIDHYWNSVGAGKSPAQVLEKIKNVHTYEDVRKTYGIPCDLSKRRDPGQDEHQLRQIFGLEKGLLIKNLICDMLNPVRERRPTAQEASTRYQDIIGHRD